MLYGQVEVGDHPIRRNRYMFRLSDLLHFQQRLFIRQRGNAVVDCATIPLFPANAWRHENIVDTGSIKR